MKLEGVVPYLAICLGLPLLSSSLHAQDPSQMDTIGSAIVMTDTVQADLHSPVGTDSSAIFLRRATLGPDRMYAVAITYPDGRPRMMGRYEDVALNIPDGEFTYYYPNGQVESTGAFDHGYKAGTWKCYTANGSARADRFYYGMDWDHMQFLVGLSELAPTLGAATESNTPFGAPSTN